MGGSHKVDVFRPLGDQIFKKTAKLSTVHGLSRRAAADGGILAVFAAHGAAAEKDGTAAALSRKGRLLPFVEHAFGNQGPLRTAAEAPLPNSPVHAAPPGTKLAVDIIHKTTSFGPIIAVFSPFHNPRLYDEQNL